MAPIDNEELSVMVFALRYAVGRHTYAPSLACGYIRKQIPRMADTQIDSVLHEIEKFLEYQ